MNEAVGVMRGILIGGLCLCGPLAAQDLAAVTDWQQRVVLSTLTDGMVEKLHVAVGAQVKRGELLLELDPRRYRLHIAAAESRRESARLRNDEAHRELDRSLELYDRTLLSDHERKLAEIEAAKSDAEFRAAEATLADLRLQREYGRIVAPFDGLVVELHVRPGQAVVNRLDPMPLATLVENRRMKALARVDPGTLAGLRLGDPVRVGVRGEWLEGEITGLGFDPVAEGSNGALYGLAASFVPRDGMGLRSGEKAVVRLRDE